MFGIGFQEMLIILVVVLIFFGPKRLPDLAKSLGKGIAEFKKASDEVKQGINEAMKEDAPAKDETPAATGPAHDAAQIDAAKEPGGPAPPAEGAPEAPGKDPSREAANPAPPERPGGGA